MKDLTLFNPDTANVQLFNCSLGQVRVIIKNGEPLFCLADICKALDLSNSRMAAEAIKNEFGVCKLDLHSFDTGYGVKDFTMITESQLYFVLVRSDKPTAKPFRQWVTNEVLPSIRKTGSYHVAQPRFKIPQTYAEALLEAGRLALENEKLITQAKENEPKVKAFNELMQSKDALDFLTFSKIIGIGRTKLFAKLRELNVLRADNTPYQKYVDSGYFRVIESSYTQNDATRIYTKTMILPKGQKYITNKVKGA